jgi:alkylation response protein AidB-like acyl-CoA dehydrogenase
MIFEFTDEQRDLRAAVRRFLSERSSTAAVRAAMETEAGHDAGVWSALVEQLGLVGLAVPERFGGDGGGAVDTAIIAEEAGRALLCAPYFGTVTLAGSVLAAVADSGDDSGVADVFERILAGGTATAAVSETSARWDPAEVRTIAVRSGDGWTLTGTKRYVVDGHTADLLLVAARREGGDVGIFAVDGDAPGLTRAPVPTLDPTRKLAELELAEVPATPLGDPAAGGRALEGALPRVLVALAAEQVGGARRCLEIAVEYAKMRHQFGVPIGSFQAVKHACADMLTQVEAADSAAYYAAWQVQDGGAEITSSALLAKVECSEAYARVAESALHVHGGIGYTWEQDIHLYLKRARASQYLFGDPNHHRELLARELGYC